MKLCIDIAKTNKQTQWKSSNTTPPNVTIFPKDNHLESHRISLLGFLGVFFVFFVFFTSVSFKTRKGGGKNNKCHLRFLPTMRFWRLEAVFLFFSFLMKWFKVHSCQCERTYICYNAIIGFLLIHSFSCN